MEGRWVAAESFLPPQGGIVWDVDYTGHPYLDPSWPERNTRLRRFTELTWERVRDDDEAYRREAARLLRPVRGTDSEVPPCQADIAVIAEYLQEADVYLYSAIDLLPASSRDHVLPTEEVNRCHDLRELLAMVFNGTDRRRRFEAQRKMYLANLLLDIDHSRLIQDGPLHLAYLEELLDETLWRHRRQTYEVQIGYHIADDGETIRYSTRPRQDDQIFTFHSSFLEWRQGRRRSSLDVLYANCRFKRSVEPLSFEVVDGHHRVLERVRWGDMRQHRSGSVLSKMIRRGINNPSEIADLLGAMFIVHDEEALNDLLELLDAGLGNPFGWRNVTDTFAGGVGADLNRYSGRGYKVFKGDVDILIPGRAPGQPPYRFTVECQVHTLESFLRTICSTHDANHLALKLRQFLGGLVPYLFPAAIYGQDWLRFDPPPVEA